VAEVLTQRVLHPVLATGLHHAPLDRLLVAEYPAVDVLGLNHEDAVLRDDDVIDLGCSTLSRDGHVVDRGVDRLVEKRPLGCCTHRLADPAFDHVSK